ncbi:exo-alpha-sialidase, partial [Bacillus safensis]|nr:exo-alpha-sialidase [Bacillus safensis]
MIDQFPGGVGQPNAEPGSGFDEQGRQLLFDRDATAYVVDAEGIVTTESGEPTDYTIDETGNVFVAGTPAGNIHLAAGVDPHESLLTLRTCNLILIHSDDDGRTWSRPFNLNPALKQPWMRFLGTSPGNGIQLEHGTHRGRLLAPVYYNHEEGKTFSCAAVYSDDGGQTWNLGKSPNDERELFGKIVSSRNLNDDRGSTHESALVETPDGVVHSFMRNQHPSGRVAHAASVDGGETWGEVT